MTGYAGIFITLEGGEGSGKSTQLRALHTALQDAGKQVVFTREPGGSEGAEQIRALLVEGGADRWDAMTELLLLLADPGAPRHGVDRWDAMTELLLLLAARRDHLRRLIIPALARGAWVLCDRFSDSTLAYQGAGGGLGRPAIEALSALALGDDSPKPDLTLILDLPVAEGLARAQSRGDGEQRFEGRGLAFHERLRTAFRDIAETEPERCAVIDATPSPDAVSAAIWATVRARFGI